MRYLITGFSGFVSYYFLEYLNSIITESEPIEILGIDINEAMFDATAFPKLVIQTQNINLLDYAAVERAILSFKPNRVLHLASFSSVASSWKDPVGCFNNNTNIFLNVIKVIHDNNISARILSIGSSEEYGNVDLSSIPLKESHPLSPVSPYAVARVSQELLSKIYVDSFKLDIVMTRSFNHIGARQKDSFVIPSFVKQICQAKVEKRETVTLETGNIDIVRDFLDVRDVVKAYFKLFEYGTAGIFYNVCSGIGHSLREIILILEKMLEIEIQTHVNPQLIRPNDNNIIVGSNQKIYEDTNWKPMISLEKSLYDISEYWMEKIIKI
jgi:GDP-4-dehydro-6-deoxy-D-mannose reductase